MSFYNQQWDRPWLTPSIARVLMTQTPLHARQHCPYYGAGDRPPATAAMDEGTIIDQIVLDGVADVVIVDAPDWRTKAAREQRDEAVAAGRIPVLAGDYDRLVAAARRIRMCATVEVMDALDHGRIKERLYWERNGVHCSTEPDIVHAAAVIDLKRTRICPTADAWRRHVCRMAMHIQAAAHLEATGAERFGWLVVEAGPPHSVVLHWAGASLIECGRRDWERAREAWRRCVADDDWPGPEGGEIEAEDWLVAADPEITFSEEADL